MTPRLSCPHAEYRTGMTIYCKVAEELCGNQFFKRCQGWWALNGNADRCPLREKGERDERENEAD